MNGMKDLMTRSERALRQTLKGSLSGLLAHLIVHTAVYGQVPADTISYHVPVMTTTAIRHASPWVDVPAALQVIPVERLSEIQGAGLDKAVWNTPGVLVFSRVGNQDVRLTIRGFGARGAGDRSNAGTSRGIRVLSDGFPETEPDGRTSFDLVDPFGAGSIEVVRSNASSTWGNAAGGVVSIRSNTSFPVPYVRAHGMRGSFGFQKDVLESGFVLGTGRLSVTLSTMSSDGWRRHSRSTASLFRSAYVARTGAATDVGLYLSAASSFFQIPGPLTLEQYRLDPSAADPLLASRNEHRSNRTGRLGVRLTHAFDDADQMEVSAFVNPKVLERSERNTFRDFNRYHLGGSATYRRDILTSETATLLILAGIDEAYQDGAILFYTLSPAGGRGSTLRADKREGAQNLGIFLSGELAVSKRWLFAAGVRYDDVTYDSESYIAPLLKDTRTFSGLTPKASVVYKLSPTHSLYASMGGGIEVPAGNETDPVPPDTVHALNLLLDPIVSTTIEVGTKQVIDLGSAWWGGMLTYDAAAYAIRITNDIIPYRNGQFYATSGLSRRIGAELGVEYQGNSGLHIQTSLTIADSRYVTYDVDSSLYDPALAGVTAGLGGNTMAGIPSLYYNASARYEPGALAGLWGEVQVQGVGDYVADDRNTISIPAWSVVHLSAGIGPVPIAGSGLSVAGHVSMRNVFDRAYIGSAWINPATDAQGNARYIEAGLPRHWFVSLSLQQTL